MSRTADRLRAMFSDNQGLLERIDQMEAEMIAQAASTTHRPETWEAARVLQEQSTN